MITMSNHRTIQDAFPIAPVEVDRCQSSQNKTLSMPCCDAPTVLFLTRTRRCSSVAEHPRRASGPRGGNCPEILAHRLGSTRGVSRSASGAAQGSGRRPMVDEDIRITIAAGRLGAFEH